MRVPRVGFAGVDVRGGLHGNPANPRRAENIYFEDDFGQHMRPPNIAEGTIDSYRDGLVFLDGQWYTFADDNVFDTEHGIEGVQALTFNVPPACYPYNWILADACVFAGHACALIWHPVGAGSSRYRLFLHVWDNKADRPTWVSDPAAMFNWKRPLPMHVGDAHGVEPWNSLAALEVGPSDYQPRMVVAGEKLWVSLPNGDMACSAIGNARTWNDRSFEELAGDGEMWYVWTSSSITVSCKTHIPSSGATLSLLVGDWVGWTCERWDESTETWQELTYNANYLTVSSGQWGLRVETANKWKAPNYPYYVEWTASYNVNTLLRFRAVAGESPVQIVDGGNLWTMGDLLPVGSSTGRTFKWETDLRRADARAGFWHLVAIAPDDSELNLGTHVASPSKWAVDSRDLDGVERATIVLRVHRGTVASAQSQYETDVADSIWGADAATFSANFVWLLILNGEVEDAGNWTMTSLNSHLAPQLTSGVFTIGDTVELCYAPISGSTLELRAIGTGIGSATIRRGTEEQEVGALRGLSGSQGWADGAGNLVGYRWDEALPIIEQDSVLEVGLDTRYFAIADVDLQTQVRIESFKHYPYPNDALEINEWFTDIKLRYINEMAGQDQTTIKATSHAEPHGEQIRSLAVVKDRLVVGYPSSVQFWHIDPLPVNDRKLDGKNIGIAGDLVEVSGMLMTLTKGGFRGLQPQGLNWDSIADTNVGEALEGVGDIDFQAGAWWPHMGLYVGAGVLTPSARGTSHGYAAGLHFFVLRLSQGKVVSWSNWRVAGIASVSKMVADGDRLYVVSGGKSRFYFDASATTFRDNGSLSYDAVSFGPFDAIGRPGMEKIINGIEIEQEGGCQVKLHLLPQNVAEVTQAMTVSGATWGGNHMELGAMTVAVAVELVANEATGWHCFGYQLEAELLGR